MYMIGRKMKKIRKNKNKTLFISPDNLKYNIPYVKKFDNKKNVQQKWKLKILKTTSSMVYVIAILSKFQ